MKHADFASTSRRTFLTGLGIGLAGLCGRPLRAFEGMRKDAGFAGSRELRQLDLPGGARLARRLLEAVAPRTPAWECHGKVRTCDLGYVQAHVEVHTRGRQSIYVGDEHEALVLEYLPKSDRLASVTIAGTRPVALHSKPAYDTLRDLPDGVELTFSSDLALRHAAPRFSAGAELPKVYCELARRLSS